jgi:hypothetical protein
MMGLTFILDVSSVAVLVSSVCNELSAAVRKRDPIRSGGYLAISVFRMDKVVV